MRTDAAGTLSGIRVLDLSSYIAGPYACSLLADMGADVIKIEAPGGDGLRQYPSTMERESRAFLGVNRSKRGIVLDLKQPEGLEVFERLLVKTDIMVHNFRPSVPVRLGVDYERLKQLNPPLIYCALTGYGDTGSLKDKAGYDQVLQAFTGISTFQGGIVLGSVVDFYAASLLAGGIAAALFHRERTGEGQYLGLSLLAAALAMQSGRFIRADGEDAGVDRDLRSGGITGIHPAKKGEIYISANTPHFWKSLCSLIGLPGLAEDARYDSVRKRAGCAAEIVPAIREALRARTAVEWEEIFGEMVPNCAVRPIEQMFDHPQVLDQELVATLEHPVAGKYRGFRQPLKFGAAPGPEPFAAPALAEHGDEILAQAGYGAAEISELRKRGIAG